MALPEFVCGDLTLHVELEDVIHLLLDRGLFLLENRQELGLVADRLVGLLQITGDLGGGQQVFLELLDEDVLQVDSRNLVVAASADILGSVGFDIHLVAAQAAPGQASEKLDRPLGRRSGLGLLLGQDGVAAIPEFFGDDGFALGENPLFLGLEVPALGAAYPLAVVAPVHALGCRVLDHVFDRHALKGPALARPVAHLVEHLGDGCSSLVLGEEFIGQFADRRLVGMDGQFLVFPAIAIRRLAAQRFAQLGPDRNRSRHPRGDFFALPVGHGSDHRVEKPAGGSGGVDRLLEGDQVGVVLVEILGEVQQFPGVAAQAGQFGKDQSADVPALNVLEHPLGFGVLDNRLTGNALQVIDLDHGPASGFGVMAGAEFVMLRAFAARLILGRDANPDADAFGGRRLG